MNKSTVDEEFLELLLSLIDDDAERSILEIISRNEDNEIVLQKMVNLLEKESNDKD
jgi:hypothetical protein